MPQHYGIDMGFQNWEQQRRLLEQLQRQSPAQLQQARDQVDLIYGSKQQGRCDLLPDADVVRLCRQGYTPGTYPPGQTYNPSGTYPGDSNGDGNGNGDGGNGNGGSGGDGNGGGE